MIMETHYYIVLNYFDSGGTHVGCNIEALSEVITVGSAWFHTLFPSNVNVSKYLSSQQVELSGQQDMRSHATDNTHRDSYETY